MEYVIIGAATWVGVSVLTAAGWAWLRAGSRRQRELEEQAILAHALMRAPRSRPEDPPGDVRPEVTPACPARVLA